MAAIGGDDAELNSCHILDGSDNSVPILIRLPELTEHILDCLPMKELNKCARVCKKWEEIVQRIKKDRHEVCWLLYDDDEDDILEQIGKRIQSLPSEPKAALLFCATKLFENQVRVPSRSSSDHENQRLRQRPAKQECIQLTEYLERNLPSACKLIGVAADGIIGTHVNSCKSSEMENSAAATSLFIPQLEGADVYPFSILDESMCQWEQYQEYLIGEGKEDVSFDTQMFHNIMGIPAGKVPKVILLFHTEFMFTSNYNPAGVLHKFYGPDVVVAGGYVDALLPDDDTMGPDPPGAGVAFCGNVKMASVVLDSTVRNFKAVQEKLKLLKNTNIPEENSIAFMFACIGRGYHFYKENSVESIAFRKLFPKTPLFGFFGNSEIGHNYLPDYSKVNQNAKLSSQTETSDDEDSKDVMDSILPQLQHSYTSIFVLLSLGSNK